jgi:hypothetical protein
MIPQKTFLEDSIEALNIVKKAEDTGEIDLGEVSFVTPFLITPVTAFIKSSKKRYKIRKPSKATASSYLDTICFSQCIEGTQLGNGYTTYLPLFQFQKDRADYDGRVSDILNNMISVYKLKENKNIIVFFLTELLANIREHSNSNYNFIYCQKYNNTIAISIVDRGITIPGSYEASGIPFTGDHNALKKAAEGISTKGNDERGTGIPYTIRCVCKGLKGSFLFFSRAGGFYEDGKCNPKLIDLKHLSYKGTIMNILFDIPKKEIDMFKFIESK